ncbi:MAG TPA: type 1 glutamine amidotransferase domain-containing protein [Terriglobales bacterium]|nr:type 1 glutamine amidotransferase domain-containing protein [Terriglobales bacterium]
MAETSSLAGVRVAILATDGVEDAELKEPRKALDAAGAQTVLIAPKAGEIYSMKHHDKAEKYKVDMTLDQANPEQFDAVLLPGGALNADTIRVHPRAQQFVRAMDESGGPIAVICHAPWLLVSADLIRGRILTSYHTIQDDLRNAGAKWQDEELVRDKNWISSRQPSDIPAFNRAMIELYSEVKKGAMERTRRVA